MDNMFWRNVKKWAVAGFGYIVVVKELVEVVIMSNDGILSIYSQIASGSFVM